MKAVAIRPGQKESAYLQEVDYPSVASDELLVRVLEVGICETDILIHAGMHGSAPVGQHYLILGHEAFGQVERVGANVAQSDWKPGDFIVCTVRRPCHETDPNCEAGRSDMCLTGQFTERGIKEHHGYMVEYYTERAEYSIKVPPPFRHIGVLLEPTSIAEKMIYQAYVIQQRLEWQPQRAVVFGAGPIGLLATLILRSKGLDVFTVAQSKGGSNNSKARVVEQCGATYLSSQEIAVEHLGKYLGQIDLMLEATGSSEVVFKGMASLGVNGVMVLTSVSTGHNALVLDTHQLNLQIVQGNQVIVGAVNANRRYFEMGLESWNDIETKWPGILERLITRRVPLEQYQQALIKDREDIKVVLQIAKESSRNKGVNLTAPEV